MDVNTLASKRSELLGNADILRMHRVIQNYSTCVCLRIPVANTQKRKNASVDLWPALDFTGDHQVNMYKNQLYYNGNGFNKVGERISSGCIMSHTHTPSFRSHDTSSVTSIVFTQHSAHQSFHGA